MASITEQILEQSGVTKEETSGVEETSDASQTTATTQAEESGTTSDTPASSKPDSTGGAADKGQTQEGQTRADPAGEAKPQPLIDRNSGQVLAEGGAERRLFNKYRHVAEKEFPVLQSKVQALENAATYKQFNLSPEEAIAGHRIMASWKQDPAKAIQYLLTQARANGINVEGIGGGVDVAAIKQMITEATKPLADQSAQREREQVVREESTQEYNAFVDRFPDAPVHDAELGAVLEHDPNITLSEAYYALRTFYAENGLDWKLPLAKAKAAKQQPIQQQRQPTTALPSGRGSVVSAVAAESNDPEIMPSDTSWGDIVRSSMREAGLSR